MVCGEKGIKFDAGKLRWSLFPAHVQNAVLRVLEYGARKYAPDNWKNVENPEKRYYDAAMRHIEARAHGSYSDPESKEPHLAHAICCLMFWLYFDIKKRKGHR